MGLVIASLFDRQVPIQARFLVVAVLAFGSALSASFLGGAAAAEGKVPIPGIGHNALIVSSTGGVAVLVIVALVGYYTYIVPAEGNGQPLGPPRVLESSNKEGREYYGRLLSDPQGVAGADAREQLTWIQWLIEYHYKSFPGAMVRVVSTGGFENSHRPFSATVKVADDASLEASAFLVRRSTRPPVFVPITLTPCEILGGPHLCFEVPAALPKDFVLVIIALSNSAYERREADSFRIVPRNAETGA